MYLIQLIKNVYGFFLLAIGLFLLLAGVDQTDDYDPTKKSTEVLIFLITGIFLLNIRKIARNNYLVVFLTLIQLCYVDIFNQLREEEGITFWLILFFATLTFINSELIYYFIRKEQNSV